MNTKNIFLVALCFVLMPLFAYAQVETYELASARVAADAYIGAADSLHTFSNTILTEFDSCQIMIEHEDSLNATVTLEGAGITSNKVDTVSLGYKTSASSGTFVIGWFEINKAFGGVGCVPREIKVNIRVDPDATAIASRSKRMKVLVREFK